MNKDIWKRSGGAAGVLAVLFFVAATFSGEAYGQIPQAAVRNTGPGGYDVARESVISGKVLEYSAAGKRSAAGCACDGADGFGHGGCAPGQRQNADGQSPDVAGGRFGEHHGRDRDVQRRDGICGARDSERRAVGGGALESGDAAIADGAQRERQNGRAGRCAMKTTAMNRLFFVSALILGSIAAACGGGGGNFDTSAAPSDGKFYECQLARDLRFFDERDGSVGLLD